MRSDDFKQATKTSPDLHDVVRRYTQGLFNQVAQSTACLHLHAVEQRTCRWLLMTHDRVGSDEFPLTQEFLAQMLGVHRPTVTAAAGTLQKAGLIRYHRGVVTILDRKNLERASCPCYSIVRKRYEQLLR